MLLRVVLLSIFIISPISLLAAERCSSGGFTCSLGIFPYSSTQQIRQTFGTMVEDLSFELDTNVKLLTTHSLAEFRRQLLKSKYDIALVGPGMFTNLPKINHYIPIARPEQKIAFIIYALDKSNIKTLADLKGKKVGRLEDVAATWIINRGMLKAAGVYDLVGQYIEYKSVQSCAFALASGLVDACGAATPLYKIIEKQIPIKFHILKQSVSLPSSVYVVHPDISKQNIKRLKEYYLNRDGIAEVKEIDYKWLYKIHESEL